MNSDQDSVVEKWLHEQDAKPLPDDGFTARVMNALEKQVPRANQSSTTSNDQSASVRKRSGDSETTTIFPPSRMRWILCAAGGLLGTTMAAAQGASWSDLTHLASRATASTTAWAEILAQPSIAIPLSFIIVSLGVAFIPRWLGLDRA